MALLALTACGGGGGGGSAGTAGGGAGGGGAGGGGAGGASGGGTGGGTGGGGTGLLRPLNLTLESGDFLEFFWLSEQRDFSPGSGTDTTVDVGRFRITLGASVLIQGREAFPLTITGDSGEFTPRWTHLAVAADGSLLGSADGAGLATIYDAASDAWTGGGMFADFAQSPLEVSLGQFDGAYNDVAAIVAGRSEQQARCEQLLGQIICADDSTEFSEHEFYKEGIGPVGYALHLRYTRDAGGLLTSTSIDKTVELIESTLAAADGSIFVPPPWEEVAPLHTPRSRHAAVVYRGSIWVLGGIDASGNALASTEVYNATTNEWIPGPPLPAPMLDFTAVVMGGSIYVPRGSQEVLVWPTVAGGWATRAPINSPGIPLWDATHYRDATFGEILVGANIATAVTPQINVGGYDRAGNQWLFAADSQPWSELLRFSVEVVGDSLFVVGGFGTSGGILDRRGARDNVMEFDLAADDWVSVGPGALNRPRDNHASVALNDRIYVFGGNAVGCDLLDCTSEAPYREVEVFDPSTGESTDVPPMFQPRKSFSAAALNGLIYVIGGSDGDEALGSVERLTPP